MADPPLEPLIHSYTGQVPPRGGRTVYDYNSDIDIKSSTTFEPGRMSRTPFNSTTYEMFIECQATRLEVEVSQILTQMSWLMLT